MPSGSSAAMRSWRWGSAARCVVRAPYMRCLPGVEIRIDGHALLSAIRYELAKLRCSACGQIFTAGLPEGAGAREIQPTGPGRLGGEPLLPGPAVVPHRSLSSHAGGAGPRCDAVGPDRGGGGLRLQGLCADGAGGGPGRADLSRRHGGAHLVVDAGKPRRWSPRRRPTGLSTPKERTGMHTTALVGARWESTPPFCITPAAVMRAKTSRGCWTNGRRVSPNRWRCRTRCRAMRWPMKRR